VIHENKKMETSVIEEKEMPGPNAKELIERSSECFSSRQLHYKAFSEYRGAIIKDVDGNTFLNFTDSTNPLGGCHPEIINAIQNQINKLIHISGATALYEPYVKLAEVLKEILPYSNKRDIKIVYCVTGTEACDYAIQLAKFHTDRNIILCYLGAFHGRTGTTLGVTTSEAKLRQYNKQIISNIIYLPYPYCFRCNFGKEYHECNFECIKYISNLFETAAIPTDVAGIILEPIQIHGGVIEPPKEYLPLIKKICRQYGIMIIDDEVYTGFCKTGKFFAIEHSGIEPDIVCLGKPMGGGMPIAAISANKEVIDPWELPYYGSLGSFAGHPVSCMTALTNIQVLQKEKIVENAAKIGNIIIKELRDISTENEIIGEVRGRGLLIGIELVKNHHSKSPAIEEAKKIARMAMKKGLLIGRSGLYRHVLKLTPPLTITKEEAEKALEILKGSLSEIKN